MKVLIGINHPEEGGTILFKGRPLKLANPHDALSSGIAMIHQELSPIPEMTVAENIYLGREKMNGPFIDRRANIRRTEELLKRLNISVAATEKMKNLSMANTQMIEIAKAISYDADLVIMDEPTSAITEVEVQHLFRMIADMKAQGISIIYITHKMDEVFEIADDVTILRDGQFIDAKPASEMNKETLINLMVGRELSNIFQKQKAEIGEPVLSIRGFTRQKEFRNVSFDVHRGEIVGMAGLMGAGRSELMMSLFGVTKRESGEVYLKGQRSRSVPPRTRSRTKWLFSPRIAS